MDVRERIERASRDRKFAEMGAFEDGADFGFRLAIEVLRERAKRLSEDPRNLAELTENDANYLEVVLKGLGENGT